MNTWLNHFLNCNDASCRLGRTILQGILSAVATNLDLLLGFIVIPNELRPFVCVCLMAILSPIMAELGNKIA